MFKIYEDMIQTLLVSKVLFTHSNAEDMFCGAFPDCESSLVFSDSLFSWDLNLFKMTQHDSTRVSDEADGSAVVEELKVALLSECDKVCRLIYLSAFLSSDKSMGSTILLFSRSF